MTAPGTGTIWILILVTGIFAFALRAPFILVANKVADLPEDLHLFLRMIPPAAFAALVLPALIRPGGGWSGVTPELIAATLAAVVAWRFRSITWTILTGMAVVMILRLVLDMG